MTLEKSIEDSMVNFLKDEIKTIEIEALNVDMLTAINKAKMQPNGLVLVSTSDDQTNNDGNPHAYPLTWIAQDFVITILSNSRRDDEGSLDMHSKIRRKMIDFKWNYRYMTFKHQRFNPQKFPNSQEGVYVTELIYGIMIKIPADELMFDLE